MIVSITEHFLIFGFLSLTKLFPASVPPEGFSSLWKIPRKVWDDESWGDLNGFSKCFGKPPIPENCSWSWHPRFKSHNVMLIHPFPKCPCNSLKKKNSLPISPSAMRMRFCTERGGRGATLFRNWRLFFNMSSRLLNPKFPSWNGHAIVLHIKQKESLPSSWIDENDSQTWTQNHVIRSTPSDGDNICTHWCWTWKVITMLSNTYQEMQKTQIQTSWGYIQRTPPPCQINK